MKALGFIFISLPLFAQMPQNETLPGDETSSHPVSKSKQFPMSASMSDLTGIRDRIGGVKKAFLKQPPPVMAVKIEPEIKRIKEKSKRVAPKRKSHKHIKKVKNGIRIYRRNFKRLRRFNTISLPAGSVATAIMLYGVEAVRSENRPLLAEITHIWTGPNQSVVEMVHCRTWISVKADFSTERVMGRAEKLSCRAPSGETFDVAIKAYIIDGDSEYLGAKGKIVMKGKAMASALTFLQEGVSAFGKAMSAAQVKTQINAQEGVATTGKNVSGNEYRYMAGETVSASTGKFLNWWIEYY